MADYCYGVRHWEQGKYETGLKELKTAAGWGSKGAQYSLGLIYFDGRHVQQNVPLAIAWLNLAAQRHQVLANLVARSVIKSATPSQRRRAKTLYATMCETYCDKVAAQRGWEHYRHWQKHEAWIHRVVATGFLNTREFRNNSFMAGLHEFTRPCVGMIEESVRSGCMGNGWLDKLARHYFNGWRGIVTVGPLKTVTPSQEQKKHSQ